MAPSTHLEASPAAESKKAQSEATIVLEPRKSPEVSPKSAAGMKVREEGSFQSSMLEYNRMTSGSKFMDLMIAITVHCVVIAAPILAGLYFTDTLNLRQLTSTFLVAPPPPPPPPPAAATPLIKVAPAHRVFENAGKLVAPTVIPKQIAEIKEAPLNDELGGIAGGVPGGVAGGSMGGVIGGVIGGVSTKVAPPPLALKDKPRAPVRVGGRVREPHVVSRVNPEYPVLAKQTHLQGTVLIDAVIDEQGNVIEMKVVSGPALLIQAAMDAVRKWKYEPTYLNDQPVSVALNVTVTFRLSD